MSCLIIYLTISDQPKSEKEGWWNIFKFLLYKKIKCFHIVTSLWCMDQLVRICPLHIVWASDVFPLTRDQRKDFLCQIYIFIHFTNPTKCDPFQLKQKLGTLVFSFRRIKSNVIFRWFYLKNITGVFMCINVGLLAEWHMNKKSLLLASRIHLQKGA
jgi:hypothetical protein